MFEIGTAVSSIVGPNRDGLLPARLCTCTVSSPTDIRTVQLIGPADHAPIVGEKILIIPVEDSWELGIQIDNLVTALALAVGERVFAAFTASGVASVLARIALDPITGGGCVKIGSGTGTAVEFARLKIAFDQLKADHDSHVHPAGKLLDSTGAACTGSTTVPAAGSTADMTAAQSPSVFIP